MGDKTPCLTLIRGEGKRLTFDEICATPTSADDIIRDFERGLHIAYHNGKLLVPVDEPERKDP